MRHPREGSCRSSQLQRTAVKYEKELRKTISNERAGVVAFGYKGKRRSDKGLQKHKI